jgi:hypothetical protein
MYTYSTVLDHAPAEATTSDQVAHSRHWVFRSVYNQWMLHESGPLPEVQFAGKKKMSNHVSFLLEAEAAKRKLAQLFQSEQLGWANHRSTTIVTRESSCAARTDTKQNSKMSHENRRERTRTALPTRRPRQMKRDLTVSSFVLALVSVGVLLAAYTDQPVFWLLIGSAPLGVLHTIRMFLRLRVNRRHGLFVLYERDR